MTHSSPPTSGISAAGEDQSAAVEVPSQRAALGFSHERGLDGCKIIGRHSWAAHRSSMPTKDELDRTRAIAPRPAAEPAPRAPERPETASLSDEELYRAALGAAERGDTRHAEALYVVMADRGLPYAQQSAVVNAMWRPEPRGRAFLTTADQQRAFRAFERTRR